MMPYAKSMLPRRRLHQLAMGAALLASATFLSAQTTWTAVSSPTTQDLWGVCHGGGQFVAVGTGGTILTSPDGNVWSQRSSGVDLWLVGVGYGNNLYVAVGDRGTVLTSPDGIAWTPRISGTTQRLNGVAYVPITNGSLFSSITRFVAVGEGGTVCTSVDGLTWTAGNVGVSGWLRGVSGVTTGDPGFQSSGAYVGGQQGTVLKCIDGLNFVPVSFPVSSDIGDLAVSRGFDILAVGAGGLIAIGAVGMTTWSIQSVGTSFYRSALNGRIGPNYSTTIQLAVGSGGVIAIPVPGRTGSWMPIQLPKSADLFAAATNDTGTQIVAAGQGGMIWCSANANPLSGVTLTSSPSQIHTGDDVTLQVSNPGVTPVSYQWQFNGVPISGATQPTLAWPNIQAPQSGTYACTVNSATASITVSTQLTVQLLSITSTPNPAYVGNDVVLQGPVSTDATAYYQWQFNGVLIAGATQPTLTLHNIQAQQSGTYVCIVTSATASV